MKCVFKVAIIGGGTMGADLAALMVRQGMPTIVKEMNAELAEKAKEKIHQRIDGWQQKGKISQSEAESKKSLLTVTGNYADLQDEGLLVIEAVPEKLELKQKVFSELENNLPVDAILTSNTSSLPIRELAEKLNDKSRLVGMHFFNPPTRMPLVEVISSEWSSEESIAAVEDFTRTTLQKTPIRVKDRPGFLINVLLGAYLKPAIAALEETAVSPEAIDEKAVEFGWPTGPFFLMDMLGLDICKEVMQVLNNAYPSRFAQSELLNLLVSKGRLGQKNGVGFYGGNTEPLEELLKSAFPDRQAGDAKEVFEKMMKSFTDEAVIALSESVAFKEDIETGCVYGLGFPHQKGGPLHLAGGYFEEW